MSGPLKYRWKGEGRTALLPPARTLSQAEAILVLKRQTFDDAVKAGWLKPCAQRPTKGGEGTKIYSSAAVQEVEDRILAGEYPTLEGAVA